MSQITRTEPAANVDLPRTFTIANNSRTPINELVAQDARAFFQTIPNGSEYALNAVEHAYVSAQLTINGNSRTARNAGNYKEQQTASFGSDDSMKDQINNAIGRKIGEHVQAVVAEHPQLRGKKKEMMETLIREAWSKGDLALHEQDRRVGQLFQQRVDPRNWTEADDRRVRWSGPSAQFTQKYGRP